MSIEGMREWFGWAVALAVTGLYVRLWRSSSAVQLRHMQVEIDRARELLTSASEQNQTLRAERDQLRDNLDELRAQYTEIHLMCTNVRSERDTDKAELIKLRENLEHEKGRHDELFRQFTEFKAHTGAL